MAVFGVTERATYKRCRRQWHLSSRNRLGLTPIVPGTALALGTLIHTALGKWMVEFYSTHPMPASIDDVVAVMPLKDIFLHAAQEEQDRVVRTYRQRNGYNIEEAKLQQISEAIIMGYQMMENYQKFWGAPLPDGFELVQAEQRIKVPVPGTLHTQEWIYNAETEQVELVTLPAPDYHYLEGRLDGILLRRVTNMLYVLEHKSYAARPRESVLRSTDQFIAYEYMVRQLGLCDADGHPYKVAGVAYDGLWKRAAPPKGSELKDLFTRLLIERPVDEMVEFETMLALELNEMASNPAIYLNRTSDGSCEWGCGMNPLCLAISRGEDADYVRTSQYINKPDDNAETENEA